jgi:choline dehydrogenase-like flavoprotein
LKRAACAGAAQELRASAVGCVELSCVALAHPSLAPQPMTEKRRVVVVGSGPAGATAALFLSRAGLEPLVVEAGQAASDLGLTARVRGVTVGKRKRPLQPRRDVTNIGDPAAVLFEELSPGGLSNHWACAVPRFSEDDFADAKRAGAAYTWPIDYRALEPWYERVEPLLRIAGEPRGTHSQPPCQVTEIRTLCDEWGPVQRLARDRGRDVVVMPYAYGGETTLTRAATPFNAFTRLVAPIAATGALSVRFDSPVQRLEWSPQQRRVSAVICRNPRTGSEERVPCRAVVLAAGAVNSAQILLESRHRDLPHGLGNASGLVGRFLHDHPLAKLVVRLGRQVAISPASYIGRPALSRSEPLYAAAFMQWSGVFAHAKSLLSGHPGRTRQLGFGVFGTMVPTAEDGISLVPARSTAERARLDLSLRHPPAARQLLEAARDELLELLTDAGWDPQLEVFQIEPPGTSVHYGGTCRMHESPSHGVVDARCRVYGAPNVVVADSAVFTTGPEKNPVLTAMALSARASQLLADELYAGDI